MSMEIEYGYVRQIICGGLSAGSLSDDIHYVSLFMNNDDCLKYYMV